MRAGRGERDEVRGVGMGYRYQGIRYKGIGNRVGRAL